MDRSNQALCLSALKKIDLIISPILTAPAFSGTREDMLAALYEVHEVLRETLRRIA